jgi:hypothetical protein
MTDSIPTFDVHEVFPDRDELTVTPTVDPSVGGRPTFTGTYHTNDGSSITVEAIRGTQATGHVTGNPVDGTRFGTVTLHFSDPAIRFTDRDDSYNLRNLLRTAFEVADSRNPDNDTPHTNAEN